MPASEADIREALALYLEDAVTAEKTGVAVERRFRQLRRIDRGRRKAIMGADLYYLEVLPAGGGASFGDRAPDQTWRTRQYPYQVTLYHRFSDADTYGASSQATWDPIVQAFVAALGAGSFLPPSGYTGTYTGRIDIPDPPSIVLDILPLDEGYDDTAHVAQATFTLTDQP
jgi:hypothetical protein